MFKLSVITVFLIASTAISSQNIAINKSGTPGNSSAILDMSDASNNTSGILLPNVSITATNAASPVVNPHDGLLVYNTNSSITGGYGVGFYYWSTTLSKWVYVNNSGNSSTVTATAPLAVTSGATPNITLGGTTNGVVYATGTNSSAVTAASAGAGQVLATTTSGGTPTFQNLNQQVIMARSSGSLTSPSSITTVPGMTATFTPSYPVYVLINFECGMENNSGNNKGATSNFYVNIDGVQTLISTCGVTNDISAMSTSAWGTYGVLLTAAAHTISIQAIDSYNTCVIGGVSGNAHQGTLTITQLHQ
jgi:hypothetical protein